MLCPIYYTSLTSQTLMSSKGNGYWRGGIIWGAFFFLIQDMFTPFELWRRWPVPYIVYWSQPTKRFPCPQPTPPQSLIVHFTSPSASLFLYPRHLSAIGRPRVSSCFFANPSAAVNVIESNSACVGADYFLNSSKKLWLQFPQYIERKL